LTATHGVSVQTTNSEYFFPSFISSAVSSTGTASFSGNIHCTTYDPETSTLCREHGSNCQRVCIVASVWEVWQGVQIGLLISQEWTDEGEA
jgi:hypothetical protein